MYSLYIPVFAEGGVTKVTLHTHVGLVCIFVCMFVCMYVCIYAHIWFCIEYTYLCSRRGMSRKSRQTPSYAVRCKSKETYAHSKETCTHSKEPYTHWKEPLHALKRDLYTLKRACTHSKETYTHSKEPLHALKRALYSLKRAYLCSRREVSRKSRHTPTLVSYAVRCKFARYTAADLRSA